MAPQVIMGDIFHFDPNEFREALKEAGITRIDTAARYTNGESEKVLGRAKLPHEFTIDTKIWYTPPGDDTLTADAIEKSLTHSLEVLGVDKVNVLYCHAPDYKTPIAEQAKALNKHYHLGQFTHLGVSNFSPEMLQEWLDIAEREDYVKPTAYEGQYNLVCRGFEERLFPLLRKHDIHFNAFSPLAGGFLLGNLTADGVQGGTRFTLKGIPFLNWYDKPSMHDAIKQFKKVSSETGLPLDELSLRWLRYHSCLGDGDGIILGAGKLSHIRSNTAQLARGPLEESIVRRLNSIWEVCKEEGKAITDHSKPIKFS